MASLPLYLFCLLVLYGCGNTDARRCNSCMTIPECPEAEKLLMDEINDVAYVFSKMKQATCEGVTFGSGKQRPTICCEDFNTIISKNNFDGETFETHASFELLPKKCGRSNGVRVIGGELANMYEIPWMALVGEVVNKKLNFHCGGSIINERYVLTAAHCLDNKKVIIVRIGEYDKNTREDCSGDGYIRVCERHLQNIRVADTILHENFSRRPPGNDIALLRLKKPINFTHKNAEPVCLPVFNNLIDMDLTMRRATASGWGITEFRTTSNILMKVEIPISTNYECAQRSQRNENDMKVLCAGELGKDTCKGDSGGPLVIEEEYNGTLRNIQFGLVSLGASDCGSGMLGVYTDIRKYMKWILDNMRE